MAIRTFNSVGGFSVGETPSTVILPNGDITTDFGIFTANLDAGALKTDSLLHANGVPWDFQQPAGSSNGQIQYYLDGEFGASSKFAFNPTSNVLTVLGTANITTVNTSGQIVSEGNVTAPNFIGNLVGNVSGNITSPGTNTEVLFNDNGLIGANAKMYFDKTSGTLTANYYSGTLTTNAQPNITSVGNLSSLTVNTTVTTANVATGNLSVTGRVTTSVIPGNDNTYDLGSSSYQWRNAWVGSNVFIGGADAYIRAIGNVLYTDAQYLENNINVGSLTVRSGTALQGDLTVSGNLTVSGGTTYVNVSNMAVEDPLINLGGSGGGADATSYDGMDRGLVLKNYKSDGTEAVNQAFIWSTGNSEFRAIADVADITNEIVTPNAYANIHAKTFLGNVEGTILTASQTNITTVGTLTNATIAGNLQVNNTANINSLKASGLTYPSNDGSSSQVMSTDGTGNLYWATIDTYRIQNGTSNVVVTQNSDVNISVGGTANVFKVKTTGANVSGALGVSGSTTTGTLVIGGSEVGSYTITTNSILSANIIALDYTSFRGVEFFVKGEDGTGSKFSVATISAVHDETDVDWSTYATVNLGGSTGSFDVNMDTELEQLVLSVTPSSSNSTSWTVQYRTI